MSEYSNIPTILSLSADLWSCYSAQNDIDAMALLHELPRLITLHRKYKPDSYNKIGELYGIRQLRRNIQTYVRYRYGIKVGFRWKAHKDTYEYVLLNGHGPYERIARTFQRFLLDVENALLKKELMS